MQNDNKTIFDRYQSDFNSQFENIPLIWKLGDVIADLYEVKSILGEGGMGIVYKVHHKQWNIDLAVKSPKPEILTEAGWDGFIKEAETWVNLGLHPNTVSCYYVRQLGEVPRIFAEYVDGGSLEDWIQNKKLYEGSKEEILKRILDISIQFAWGLQFAHEQGLVHRDVKPANVLLSSDRTVKVTDFGIAEARIKAGERSQFSEGKSIMVSSGGMTLAYCSPEQAEKKSISRKTDIWSWAVSVLEMFTGGVHWTSGAIAKSVLRDYMNGLQGIENIPEIPKKLTGLLLHCFIYNPEDRPKDFIEISNKLIEIYVEIIGEKYHLEIPKPVELIADSLNNKAVSCLDLNNKEKAKEYWQKALKIDPHHLESIYNLGYYQWQNAEITDVDLVNKMNELNLAHNNNPKYWLSLAWIHYERGDIENVDSIQKSHNHIVEEKFLNALKDKKRPVGNVLKKLEGHEEIIRSVCFLSNDKYLLSGSDDNTIRLWDIELEKEIMKIRNKLFNIRNYLYKMYVSSNDKYILCLNHPVIITLWNLKTGTLIRNLVGHQGPVNSICFSPDGKYILSGGADEMIRLWDTETGNEIKRFISNNNVIFGVTFSPDNKQILSRNNNNILRLWDTETGKEIHKIEVNDGNFETAIFSNDGKYILSGNYNNLRLWDTKTGKIIRNFIGHTKEIQCVNFSRDDKFIFSGSNDGTIRCWETASGKNIREFKTCKNILLSINLSEDGKYILSNENDFIRLWDIESGRQIRTFEVNNYSSPVSINHTVKSFLTVEDNNVLVWKIYVPSKKPKNNFPLLNKIKNSSEIINIKLLFNNQISLVKKNIEENNFINAYNKIKELQNISYYDRINELLNLKYNLCINAGFIKKKIKNYWCKYILKEHSDAVCCLCFSDNGKYFASSSYDNLFYLWDTKNGKRIHTFINLTAKIKELKFTKDNKHIISIDDNNELRLWDCMSGKSEFKLKGSNKKFVPVSISSCTKYILFCDLGVLHLMDIESGSLIRKYKWDSLINSISFDYNDNLPSKLCFSPDNKYILSVGILHYLHIWNLASGKELKSNKNISVVYDICYSHNRKYILISGPSGTGEINLIDSNSLEIIKTFSEGYISVFSVSFCPDNKYIVSGTSNDNVVIWDIESGQAIHKLIGHTAGVDIVKFSPKGRFIISGSRDKTIRLWELDWEWELPEPADWDEGARPYLEIFLELHRSYGNDGLTRLGKPIWNDNDFKQLLDELKIRGFGWLRPEGVRKELEKMTNNYY